jgi:hypothetical protein
MIHRFALTPDPKSRAVTIPCSGKVAAEQVAQDRKPVGFIIPAELIGVKSQIEEPPGIVDCHGVVGERQRPPALGFEAPEQG